MIKQTPDYLPLNDIDFTAVELIDCYNCVFDKVHSVGFVESEMKDLLFKEDYWFAEQPINNWKDILKNKLTKKFLRKLGKKKS